MGRADYLELGDYNAACSMCGRKRKASQLVRNWQGMYRCPEHNEVRQPQDFVRVIPDVMSVPWAQKETDQFTKFCTYNGISAIPGLMLPGCSLPGRKQFNLEIAPFTGGPVILGEGDFTIDVADETGDAIITEGVEPV